MRRFVFLLLTYNSFAFANTYQLESFKIFADKEAYTEPGAIYKLNKDSLKQKKQFNAHEVLKEVPGVSLQKEDGFGLRLNIGLRGVQPHRSKKITLMEDSILIAPAPYSAPAAYYSPLFTRVSEVEVYKGPSSLKYGPNSIGGAINFVTKDFKKNKGAIDLSAGSYGTYKMGLWKSMTHKNFSWLIDYNRLQSDGFKEIIGSDQNLGFFKNDFLVKGQYRFESKLERVLGFKFSWSEEESNETYLGLSPTDFNQNHKQRYEASSQDELDWTHKQFKVFYFHEWSPKLFTDTQIYRHNFNRTWDKLNGFKDGSIDVQDVLLSPVGQNADFLKVLKGEKNSTASEALLAGVNARNYYSQGIKSETEWSISRKDSLDLGLLLHKDQIERSHLLQDKAMVNGKLTPSAPALIDNNNNNIDTSLATRVFAVYKRQGRRFLFKSGLRYEYVDYERKNKITGAYKPKHNHILIPGLGLSYKLNSKSLIFFGAHKGATLPSPGQSAQIKPEESFNYELGFRHKGFLNLELVGFYSDYKNILGTCTFSTGCLSKNLDLQYNGGKAKVYGLEFLTSKKIKVQAWSFPVRLSATYTVADFNSSFTSKNKEWGDGAIKPGDPMPYIPNFVANLSIGAQYKKLQGLIDYNYQSSLYDQSAATSRKKIKSFQSLNLNASYQLRKDLKVYAQVNNALDEVYISTLRPFGLRPGSPRWYSLGLNYEF